jgi:hypothetical protein
MRRGRSRLGSGLLAAAALLGPVRPGHTESPPDAIAPIRDNSFLVEEAFNQERRVVQHISTWSGAGPGGGWLYAFTDEWPLGGASDQLSFTVPFQEVPSATAVERGFGDLGLHYRRQWLGVGGGGRAFMSRISALLPTGSEARGLGQGAPGAQLNLALSLERGMWAAHSNLGATWIGSSAARSNLVGVNLGESIIWLAAPAFNVLLEAVYDRREPAACPCADGREEMLLLAPGVRWAHTAPGGLQVVPGISMPVGLGPSRGENSVFLYLSLEHGY